jgi:hypothetical protein
MDIHKPEEHIYFSYQLIAPQIPAPCDILQGSGLITALRLKIRATESASIIKGTIYYFREGLTDRSTMY